ncbi:hypothetical protein U0070_027587, partial [Myodes glareolus]
MVKIDLRTKSYSGVEFSTSRHVYTDTEKASGNLETKYKVCDYGTHLHPKAEGLKLTLDTIFVPNTGKKSGKFKTSLKRDCFSLSSNVDIDFSGPTIYGLAAADFQLHTHVNDDTEFGGSIYQKVNEKIEMSINLSWTPGSNNTRFGITAKYNLDCRTSLSA